MARHQSEFVGLGLAGSVLHVAGSYRGDVVPAEEMGE